jgi:uncharacterized protein YneF (UPF0154 family)
MQPLLALFFGLFLGYFYGTATMKEEMEKMRLAFSFENQKLKKKLMLAQSSNPPNKSDASEYLKLKK